MLPFLANIVEQLDLALEHLGKRDVNNARFCLMLTDNVVELVLHQIAKDKKSRLKHFAYQREGFQHEKELDEALGRYFDKKVKLAKMLGIISAEVSESILIFHLFRNDIYHVGVQHEAVLLKLAAFYLQSACDVVSCYSPLFFSWGSGDRLPDRAKKYLHGDKTFPAEPDDFPKIWATLGLAANHSPSALINSLASHMGEVIEEQDGSLDFISQDAPRRVSRDQVVIDCQTWPLAFTEKGRSFAEKNGWPGGSHFTLVDWLATNYPLKYKGDPISAWRRRTAKITRETNPHNALKMYRTFMDETVEIREAIDETARQVDAYIDNEIERARGN
jgi:hypothetical protein